MTPPASSNLRVRWPAEWEPHRATWLSWPHNKETWPSGLGPVEDAFCEIVRAIVPGEQVEINVDGPGMAARVRGRLEGAGIDLGDLVHFHFIPTDDAWIRDHGGMFLLDAQVEGGVSVADFEFDAWGGKYPPWDRDARVAAAMAEARGFPRRVSEFVLEAGSIDGDGEGTILTTESCLLNVNRLRPGQSRDREAMESLLVDSLGAKKVIWLEDGIEGDDTDGHVDDLTRFVGPGRVVTIVASDARDSDAAQLAANRERLVGVCDAAGRALEIIDLPTPGRIANKRNRLPASYANFYIANQSVLVPTFDVPADREALEELSACFPTREIIPIPARVLVEGLGAVHCLAQQEPISRDDCRKP